MLKFVCKQCGYCDFSNKTIKCPACGGAYIKVSLIQSYKQNIVVLMNDSNIQKTTSSNIKSIQNIHNFAKITKIENGLNINNRKKKNSKKNMKKSLRIKISISHFQKKLKIKEFFVVEQKTLPHMLCNTKCIRYRIVLVVDQLMLIKYQLELKLLKRQHLVSMEQ